MIQINDSMSGVTIGGSGTLTTQPHSSAALKNMKFTVFHGNVAHTPKMGELYVMHNGAVGVDTEGTITFISENCCDPIYEALKNHPELDEDSIEVVCITDKPYGFFFPGFIDTHIHAPQFPNSGLGTDYQLLDWLTELTFPLEASLKDLDRARTIYSKVIQRTLENGTTCASYFATIDADATNILADYAFQHGQRALIGRVCMDANSPDYYIESFEEAVDATHKVIDHIQAKDPSGDIIKPILTPRFAPSCTSKLMNYLGDLRVEKNLPVQTHISENKQEIEWVKELFPNSTSYTGVYDDHNLLSSSTILAHAIHLSDEEVALIKSRQSCISHCPISNSSITSGEARIRYLVDNDVPVSLGTDMSGGFSPSILSSARQALLVSRHLSMKTNDDSDKLDANDVLYLATMGGARSVSMQDKLGSIEVGKKWDAQLIDLDCSKSQVDVFDWQNPNWGKEQFKFSKKKFNDLIAKWVFNGDDRNTVKVWCNGRLVLTKE